MGNADSLGEKYDGARRRLRTTPGGEVGLAEARKLVAGIYAFRASRADLAGALQALLSDFAEPDGKVALSEVTGGMTGCPVYRIGTGPGIGYYKIFKELEGMLREVGAHRRIRAASLGCLRGVETGHPSVIDLVLEGKGTVGGGVMLSPAQGNFVSTLLEKAASVAGTADAAEKQLELAIAAVAKGLCALHKHAPLAPSVRISFLRDEVKWLVDKWDKVQPQVSSWYAGRTDLARGIEDLCSHFIEKGIEARFTPAIVHGDAHTKNYAVDSDIATVIDLETIYRSMDANGNGCAPRATDVGRFAESVIAYGARAGVALPTVRRLADRFVIAYYDALLGSTPPEEERAALRFYRVNYDLLVLRETLRLRDSPSISLAFALLEAHLP